MTAAASSSRAAGSGCARRIFVNRGELRFTVRTLLSSRAAISLLLNPMRTKCTSSRSATVSSLGSARIASCFDRFVRHRRAPAEHARRCYGRQASQRRLQMRMQSLQQRHFPCGEISLLRRAPDHDLRREPARVPEQRGCGVVPAFGRHVSPKELRCAQPVRIRHDFGEPVELDARIRQRERRHHVHFATSLQPLARTVRVGCRQDARGIPRPREIDVVEVCNAGVVRHELVEDQQQRAPELMDVDARVQAQQRHLEARIIERRCGRACRPFTRAQRSSCSRTVCPHDSYVVASEPQKREPNS